jgi:LEA14-like dessication related protein
MVPMRLFLVITVFVQGTGCLSYKDVVMHHVENVDVVKLDAKGIALRAKVKLENPNGFRIHVKDPDVDLYLNGTFVGKGFLDSSLVLPRRSTAVHTVPLHAEFKGANLLVMVLGSALSGEARIGAKGTVVGQAGWIRKRFPFEMEEALDLRRSR